MTDIRIKPEDIFREYEKCVSYNNSIGLYDTVKRNENFYNDRQWEGLNAPDLDKPVFNFLKPVVNYYVSTLVSDDVAYSIEFLGEHEEREDKTVQRLLKKEIDCVFERENIKYKNRTVIRNCAVDGDGCLYFYFQPKEGKGFADGNIRAEVIRNTDVLFGDPCENETEKQPFIIISYRRLLGDVIAEAKKNGQDYTLICSDNAYYYEEAEREADNLYVTLLLKMWKKDGSVRAVKVTKNAVVMGETDLGYGVYPVAFMSWETGFNSYHGISPLTGKIQNQTFVNKLYAMAMEYTKKMAFPKLLYDRTKIPEGWNNSVGRAIAVTGNPNEAFFSNFQNADMSSQVMKLIESTIAHSKDMMGAFDAALGNVDPKNTSAIIATQKAAAAPLDIQRMEFYNFVESYIRIILEMMRVNYGIRKCCVENDKGGKDSIYFDFSGVDADGLSLKIEIGKGNYWSEIMQVSTLDNLMREKIIPSASIYLENMLDGYIPGKQRMLEKIKEIEEAEKKAFIGREEEENV